MHKVNKIAYFTILAVIATIGVASVAHAETSNDLGIAKDAFAQGSLIVAGTGALSGVILSISRVIGKNLSAITSATPTAGQTKLSVELEALDIGKLVLTSAIGVAIGFLIPYLHIGLDNSVAGDFLLTFLVSQFIVPVFATLKAKLTPKTTS